MTNQWNISSSLNLGQFRENRHQRFLRQHVDPHSTGGTDSYCNSMMQSRGMATPFHCKEVNTFIHDNPESIRRICDNPNIMCNNGQMNCHAGVARVTECREIKTTNRLPVCRQINSSSSSNVCNYQAKPSTREIVIACEGNPPVPVHFDK